MPKEVSEMIDAGTMKALHKAQQNEITEYHIYLRLSSYMKKKNEHNSKVLQQIARDELRHHDELKSFTGTEKKPSTLKIYFYTSF